MIQINPERLLSDLRTLATFGAYKTGVHRPALSEQDMAARHWVATRLEAAGLDAKIDGIGNVYGLRRGHGRRVLSGSHLETQNHAGWLDGAMGVIYALEASRALYESNPNSDVGVDVVAFCDEEGHFSSYLGSRSLIGELQESDVDSIIKRETGQPLRQALAQAGLAGVPRQQLDVSRYTAFMEAHIEQGNTLECMVKSLGVVTGIVGIWQYQIVVVGQQNHAGTTMMSQRRDAGVALVRLLAALDQRFPEIAGERTVWTTGKITLDPGERSIIPGRAEALLQIRDVSTDVLARLDNALDSLVRQANQAGPCTIEVH